MFHRFFAGCALVAVFVFSGAASARAATPSPAPSELPEIGRVTTSDRRPEPIDRTSRPTFVVTRAQFEAYGAHTVADVLRLVPGIPTFVDYYGFGTVAYYGIRGAKSSQTLVLLDGMPIAGASSGTIDLGTYPLTGIQRIEIVESGSSLLYGTSAIGGIINMITAPQHGTDAAVAGGSYADRDLRAAFGDGALGAELERRVVSNNFAYPAFNYQKKQFPPGVRTNTWAMQSAFRMNADQRLGGPYALRADVGFDQIEGGVPGRLDFTTPFATERVARNSASFELSRLGAQSVLSLAMSAARQGLVYINPGPRCGGESDTYDSRTQLSLKNVISSERNALVAGIDMARESAAFGLYPAGLGAAESQTAAYAQEQLDIVRGAQLNFGLRGENDAPHGSALVSSFGATISLGQVRLAGNVGESFRVPTLTDLYYPGFSNPNLVPERALNSDVTLELPNVAGGLSLGWFARDGTNFIVLDSHFVPKNVGRASVAGLMLTAKTAVFEGFVVEGNLTNLYRAQDLTKGTRLPRSPVLQASLGLTKPFGASRLAYGLRANVIGGTYAPADTPFGSGSNVYDSYTTLDAFVRVKLQRNAILSARVRNLANERDAPVAGYPAVGRTFSLELSTR